MMGYVVIFLVAVTTFALVRTVSDSFLAGWVGGIVCLTITQALDKAMP